jgi:hypothetical protein
MAEHKLEEHTRTTSRQTNGKTRDSPQNTDEEWEKEKKSMNAQTEL